MKRLLRPSIVIPAAVSVLLLAAIVAFGNVTNVVAVMRGFQHIYLPIILALTTAYEVVQYAQWHLLLSAIGIKAPGRARFFSFMVGSATKMLPIGNFFENYLLLRAEGTDFGLTSSATLLSVLTEVGVSLAALVIIGLDGWTWLRPLIVIGLAVFVSLAWLVTHSHYSGTLPARLGRHRAVRVALDEVHQFRVGAGQIMHPRVVLAAAALGAVYLLLGGTTLFLVLDGLRVSGVSWPDVMAVYFFSLVFGLIFPLPVDIGVTEASGVGAFLAIGIAKSDAVGAMLILRVVTFGAALAIALVTMAVMPDEVRAVFRARSRRKPRTERAGEPGPKGPW